jgi:hypothetical protein
MGILDIFGLTAIVSYSQDTVHHHQTDDCNLVARAVLAD